MEDLMKLLTLNTYSWVQTADPRNLRRPDCTDCLENEYDAIAPQEVDQLSSGTSVNEPEGYLPTQNEIPIKSDNFAYFLVKSLARRGPYHWSWVPCHQGYFRFDGKVAILNKAPIQSVEQVQLSVVNDFENIHTRRALVLETEAAAFTSTFLGGKRKKKIRSYGEWTSVEAAVKKLRGTKPIYVMGDVNNPADVRNEGYDLITNAGWQDAYAVAATRIGSTTTFRRQSTAGKETSPPCASTISSQTSRKRSKRTKSNSTGRNCLACLIIMGLR